MNFTEQSTNSSNSKVAGMTFDKTLKLSLSVIIFTIGFLGNLIVLWILKTHKTKSLRPPFEYFIANLSIVDLVFGLALLAEEHFDIPRSQLICKAVVPIVSVTYQASMNTIIAIAVFRCIAILAPFKTKPSKAVIFGTIAGIWVTSYIVYIPFIIVLYYNENTGQCNEKWPSQIYNKVYTVILFVIQYPIPSTIIAICYTKIVLFLTRQTVPFGGSGLGNQLQQARKRKQDKLIMKMSVIIILLYTILTLPSQMAWLSLIVFEDSSLSNILFRFSSVLALTHTCCNPIVYGLMSKQFRAQFVVNCKSIVPCKGCSNNRIGPFDRATLNT